MLAKNLYSFFILILYILLAVVGLKREKCIDFLIHLKRLNKCRGGAVLILVHHIVDGNIPPMDSLALFFCSKLSICVVSFFFFISGIGLAYSYKNKKNYLSYWFLIRKPVFLFIVSSFYNYLKFFISFFVFHNVEFSLINLLNCLIYHNWFIYELCVMYILFFFIFKYIKNYTTFILLFLSIVLWCILCFLGFGLSWLVSFMAFPLGIVFFDFYNNIIKRQKECLLIILFLGLLSLPASIFPMQNCLSLILKTIFCMVFVSSIFFITLYFDIYNNSFSRKFTAISLEIYMVQGVGNYFVLSTGLSFFLAIPVSLAIGLFLAFMTHPIILKIRSISNFRKEFRT